MICTYSIVKAACRSILRAQFQVIIWLRVPTLLWNPSKALLHYLRVFSLKGGPPVVPFTLEKTWVILLD